MSRAYADQRGFALLIVLWSLGLLALLGTQSLTSARQETQLARNLVNAAELEAAANGALQRAIFATLDMSNRHWDADSVTRMIRVGRVSVAVRVDNEAEKVNPNIASVAVLQALLTVIGADHGLAAGVAASIAEWRQPGGVPGRTNPSAARYVAAGRDYAPSGAPFTSLDEVGSVLGITPDLLARLRPHLTIFTDGDPDLGTRDPAVAQALMMVGQNGGGAGEALGGLVSITADARSAAHTRFTVHAIVRTNAQANGRRYEMLAYERSWGDVL
jgi:general secretion pathway protein K